MTDSPLYDPEQNRIINLLGPLNHVHLPVEMLSLSSDAIKVYCVYVRIAQGFGDKDVELPPTDEFCAACFGAPRTVRRLHRAEKELQDAGWIIIRRMRDRNGRETRRHAVVKYDRVVIASQRAIEEIIERSIAAFRKMGDSVADTALDIICNPAPTAPKTPQEPPFAFTPSLRELIDGIPLRDESGARLADYSDRLLWDRSGHAAEIEIEHAITYLRRYKPSGKYNKAIKSIVALFSGCFALDEQGRGTFARRDRPMLPKLKDNTLPANVISEQDAAMRRLMNRQYVQRGELPLGKLLAMEDRHALVKHPTERNLVKLDEDVTLIECGKNPKTGEAMFDLQRGRNGDGERVEKAIRDVSGAMTSPTKKR